MYKQETIKPYDGKGEKGELVEAMFDNIAPTYDTLNHHLSWDIDKYWRKKAVKAVKNHFHDRVKNSKKHAAITNGLSILDIATGTGDFAILAAKKLHPEKVVGADISEGMMKVGREKVRREGLDGVISFAKEDCLNLSFEDESFDTVMAAFGIRNFQHLDKGLEEMCRVMKKGGMLCVLELTTPVSFPMKQLFRIYSHTILPVYGKLISKDDSAYSYLTATIEAFPQGEEMVGILKKAGFRDARFKRLTFGICTMYLAVK